MIDPKALPLKTTAAILTGLVVIVLSVASCKKAPTYHDGPPSTTIDTTKKPVYALVWSDEFDSGTIDATKWNFETGGGGWGNNEKENYQASNATIADGNLVITAKKESVGGEDYTSARMTTQGKFSQAYGRVEARIKIPVAQGLWPAFWMLGENINTVSWPTCGELDIMEHINTDNVIYGTMHWNSGGHVSYGLSTTTTTADYHVYAIEWDANEIRWFVDDNLYMRGNIKANVNNTGAFHLPFFVILNLAVGGNWPGAVNDGALPGSMYVDYVRIYKQTN
jgi:beta-glucanase (GH16 family)